MGFVKQNLIVYGKLYSVKNLEEKINAFENRLKITEKLNLEELDLDKKANKIFDLFRSKTFLYLKLHFLNRIGLDCILKITRN